MAEYSCSLMVLLTLFSSFLVCINANFDYKDALKKSIIFLEAQRSGKLPPHHRPPWRGDSALDDGKAAGVSLRSEASIHMHIDTHNYNVLTFLVLTCL